MRFSLFRGFQDLFRPRGHRGGGKGRGRRRSTGFQPCPIVALRSASRPSPIAAEAPRSPSTPGRLARVDGARCKGCQKCALVCRSVAITFAPRALIDADKCTGCGKCLAQCPNQALSLVPV